MRGNTVSKAESHVFICFSSRDEPVALEVVDFLEENGLKCWISVRDVAPGHNYQETIVQALEAAQGVVFLFSESSGKSGEIKKELSIGASMNMPVFPLRLSPITPSGALRYELATRQWIDIFPDRQQALRKLVQTIKRVINAPAAADEEPLSVPRAAPLTTGNADTALKTLAATKNRAQAPIVEPGSEQFDAIRALLAHHVGPIAKVLLTKAATDAATVDELCERLGAHVTTPAERTALVKAVRTRLAVRP
jgi:TIR domain